MHNVIPLIRGDFSDMSASPTCLLTPVLVPPVRIQAPVVFAAFKRPLRRDLLMRGWRSKLALPPVVVINNFGLSKHHSLSNKLKTSSGFVSKAKRMYWALFVWVPRKSTQLCENDKKGGFLDRDSKLNLVLGSNQLQFLQLNQCCQLYQIRISQVSLKNTMCHKFSRLTRK